MVQLVGFVPPNAIGGVATHVPPVTEYAALPLRGAVNVNSAVSAILLKRTVTVFVLGTPGPRSLKTTGLAGVTTGTVPVPLRVADKLPTESPWLVAVTVTVSLAVPAAVGANVTFIVQEPLAPAPAVQPLVSTLKGAVTPVTVTLFASMTEDESAVRVNASVVKLAPTSTLPDAVAVAARPETPVALRVTGEGVTVNELVTALIVLVAPTVTESVNVPVAVGLNFTFIVQEPPSGAPLAQPVSTEKGNAMPFTTTLPASMTELASAVRVNVAVATLAPTSTLPLPIVVAVTVAVWPKAAPLASRTAEAASPDLIRRDLRILNRIVVLPES
jgi:ribosomal protein L11